MMSWGVYLARCVTFKRWVDKCATSVKISLGLLPRPDDPIQYNATMHVKAIPPTQENLGRTFIDVVDQFDIHRVLVPENVGVIVQNEFQSELFHDHETHIIEHWYNSDPSDTYTHEIKESSPIRVGTVCLSCPEPEIPEMSNVNFTMINEEKSGRPAEGEAKYPTLKAALSKMHSVSVRKKCQEEGLSIAEEFSPDIMVKRLLSTLGYKGGFNC
ncbi:hypothetical protein ACHAXS_003943 [Conticribra weissflogii]